MCHRQQPYNHRYRYEGRPCSTRSTYSPCLPSSSSSSPSFHKRRTWQSASFCSKHWKCVRCAMTTAETKAQPRRTLASTSPMNSSDLRFFEGATWTQPAHSEWHWRGQKSHQCLMLFYFISSCFIFFFAPCLVLSSCGCSWYNFTLWGPKLEWVDGSSGLTDVRSF